MWKLTTSPPRLIKQALLAAKTSLRTKYSCVLESVGLWSSQRWSGDVHHRSQRRSDCALRGKKTDTGGSCGASVRLGQSPSVEWPGDCWFGCGGTLLEPLAGGAWVAGLVPSTACTPVALRTRQGQTDNLYLIIIWSILHRTQNGYKISCSIAATKEFSWKYRSNGTGQWWSVEYGIRFLWININLGTMERLLMHDGVHSSRRPSNSARMGITPSMPICEGST